MKTTYFPMARRMRLMRPILALSVAGARALSLSGAETTHLAVESHTAIYSIEDQTAAPNNQVHFPFMHVARDGTWYMTVRQGPHAWGFHHFGRPADPAIVALLTDDRVQTIMSSDQGQTWRGWPGLKETALYWNTIRLFRTRLPEGKLVSAGYVLEDLAPDGERASSGYLAFRSSADDGANWSKQRRKLSGLPFPFLGTTAPLIGVWGRIAAMGNGRLLVTIYGNRNNGLDKNYTHGYQLGYLESLDNGETWHFGGWITRDTELGKEGANEASIVNLGGNRLLVVVRTGYVGDSPLYLVRSSDGGRTWGKPESTGIQRGVSPQLLELSDHTLIMSYGTRGGAGPAVWLQSSRDAGDSWDRPLMIYHGPGTGYTDIEELAGNMFQVVYDEAFFFPNDPRVARNQIARQVIRLK